MNKKQVREIFSTYDLGEFRSWSPTKMGFGNDNYVVKTTKGKYVLRIYRDVRKISELRYEVEFTDHLLAKGFPYEIPKWLPNKSGELI
ncbi:phosphotransferase, partial [Candidatus Woesearchaeota archaeon]|nr:phosphotransferase [Candidatus Woesearchaeota archaeon]